MCGIKKISFLFVFILIQSYPLFSQKDVEFWFAAPHITKQHYYQDPPDIPNTYPGATPVSVKITTFENPAHVEISIPANFGFTAITRDIDANSTVRIPLWEDLTNPVDLANRKNIENYVHNAAEAIVPQNKGLQITATNDITCYYEIEEYYNTDIFALKGRNGLGTDFFVPFQTNGDNGAYDDVANRERTYSSIDIVAVDVGVPTQIRVFPTNPVLGFGSAPFTVTLGYGQTISLIPDGHSKDRTKRLAGTRIVVLTPGKRIAVTMKDDSVIEGGCRDLVGDQMIPVAAIPPVDAEDQTPDPIIGTDYIVMKGHVGANREKIYILATQPGTVVEVTGISPATATTTYNLNAQGQTPGIIITSDVTFVRSTLSDKPIYVLHVTGAGNNCELGGSILPSISRCSGSFKTGFIRSENPDNRKNFYLNVMGRKTSASNALDDFKLIRGDGAGGFLAPVSLPSASFIAIPGTDWWAASFQRDDIIPLAPNFVVNDSDVFHLGVMHGDGSGGGSYGYFSNYGSVEAISYVAGSAQPNAKICYGQTIQLFSDGGSSYEWIPSTYLDDPFAQMPYCTPFNDIKYKVIVRGASCTEPDTSQISVIVGDSLDAKFVPDIYQGCAPLRISLTDYSYGVDHKFSRWDWGDGAFEYGVASPAPHVYTNKTDTFIDFTVKLVAHSLDNICTKSWTNIVRIYPEIKTGFDQDVKIGCHPLAVQFTDTSSGNLDTSGYYWSFGTLGQSFDVNPAYTFTNIGTDDSTYTVRLITQSPFLCSDTFEQNIVVHPYIKGHLAIDQQYSCSPLNIDLNPLNSQGVDTFLWKIDYGAYDSIFKKTSKTLIPITFTDTSQVNGPDTLKIDLITLNRMGCSDTVEQQKIIVYPVVQSDFTITDYEICDSTEVEFTNNSIGYNLLNNWNFGNGTSASDSTKIDYQKIYLNRTDSIKDYIVTLNVVSDYLCSSLYDTVIKVYPYVDAAFSTEFPNTCSPLNVRFVNQSHRVQQYFWDYGNGDTDNSSLASFYKTYVNDLDYEDTTYFIKLNVISQEGCEDSAFRSITISPRVIADFTMDQDTGCNPLQIQFTNNSKGKDLNYKWKFGNLETADVNFTRLFDHYKPYDSTFLVSLTTSNQYCDSTVSKPVTVFAYIDADFNVMRYDSCSPFNVRIRNNSPAGVTSYRWNFGDGSPESALPEPTHTYRNTGLSLVSRQLKLIVKNNHECYDELIRPITIYPEIKADFNVDHLAGCHPLTVDITNINYPNINYTWDFGDGVSTTNASPDPHTYYNNNPTSLTRNLELNALSIYGCSDDCTQVVTIYPNIFAKFATSKTAVCSDEPFTIDRTASKGGIDEYRWDFDNDGLVDEITSSPVFPHSYTNTSTSNYDVTINLTVANEQLCDTSWLQNITVHPEVNALFNIDNHEPCYPYQSAIQNTSLNRGIVATKFFWQFGDGDVSTETQDLVFHRFNNFSNTADEKYVIKLIAESDYECRDTITDTITIHPKPKADFNFPVTVDCPPFTVLFTNDSKGVNLNYEWDFGDATGIITDVNPDHIFYNNGYDIVTNAVLLKSTTEFTCWDTVSKPINIFPKVNVDFQASAWQGCSPLTVNFNGTAINQNDVTWYLNGSAFSTLENSSYRFINNTPDEIIYDINFKATSIYNCTDDTTKQVTVSPSPLAEFIPDPILQDFNTLTDITQVNFTNYTMNQTSDTWGFAWDYGNGTSDSNSEPSFIKEYDHWGDIANDSRIPITLAVWNKNNPECRDTSRHEIIIRPPLPKIDIADDVAGCVPLKVQFGATTKYIYEDSYEWSFGYNDETGSGSDPEFTYPEPGIYIVKLVVEGDGGLNWDYKKITVYPKPTIDFAFSPETVLLASQNELPDTVHFFNNTMNGNEYIWDFGDEFTSEEAEPYHVYEAIGTYYVTLLSSSTEGCVDTFRNPTPVVVEGARLLEFPTAFFVNPDLPEDETYNPNDNNRYIFRPKASGVLKYRLEIYNRWGELIFVTEDISKGWNGFVDGKAMKQDVYIWRATATFTDGKPIIKAGDVTLLIDSNQVE